MFGLVSPPIRVFWSRFSNFEFPGPAMPSSDNTFYGCSAGPLSLSNIVLDKRGPGTATITRPFQDGFAEKFRSEKSPLENPNLWTYKTIDSFFCYASDINCVQIAFCEQLVEIAKDPFKYPNIVAGKWWSIPRKIIVFGNPWVAKTLSGRAIIDLANACTSNYFKFWITSSNANNSDREIDYRFGMVLENVCIWCPMHVLGFRCFPTGVVCLWLVQHADCVVGKANFTEVHNPKPNPNSYDNSLF